MLNLAALLLFIVLTVLAYMLIKKDYISNDRFLKAIAIFLLAYKSVDILLGITRGEITKYPVEFSAIFYFFFPIVILSNNRKILGVATSGAFISGAGYLLTLIFNIENMVKTHQDINNMQGFYLGMLSHSILYLLATMYMTREKFNYKKEILVLNAITVVIAIHAQFMRNFIDYTNSYRFIYMLIDADVLPVFKESILLRIIYYPIVLGIFNGVAFLFYRLNFLLHNKHEEAFEIRKVK